MKQSYRVKRWIVIIVLAIILGQFFVQSICDIGKNDTIGQKVYYELFKSGIEQFNPYMLYIGNACKNENMAKTFLHQICQDMPLEKYALEAEYENSCLTEYLQEPVYRENWTAYENDIEKDEVPEDSIVGNTDENRNSDEHVQSLEEAVMAENTVAAEAFVPVQAPVATYSGQQLREPGFIKETFYCEDATTQIKEEQLAYDALMGFDASLKQDNSNVQILVYHTHSQEAYIDSVSGDANTSIVGVGEHLCNILKTQYGFNVLHHTGEYDIDGRDYAYSNAMAGLGKVLAENPTIEVMIDLHRDETRADTKLVTTVQNRPMAKFMFFNGLCYTRELGKLENLPNPYIQDNLSFSFQLQLVAEEYYPGITRRIYLKGYRYNLHYRPKSLLIELGSQNNTVEEAMNSCEPLAHIIALVLIGKNKE